MKETAHVLERHTRRLLQKTKPDSKNLFPHNWLKEVKTNTHKERYGMCWNPRTSNGNRTLHLEDHVNIQHEPYTMSFGRCGTAQLLDAEGSPKKLRGTNI